MADNTLTSNPKGNPTEPTPWRLEQEGRLAKIVAANGVTIMSNPKYYPWCPNAVKSWELIVAAVNAYTSPSNETFEQPSIGLLMSMAIRMDHGLGVPGYYDQPMFGTSSPTHKQRLDAAITTARQMWEEVVGRGFYRPEKEAEYASHSVKANSCCTGCNSTPCVCVELANSQSEGENRG